MARPKRNAALTPEPSGPLTLPSRTWFQWAVGIAAVVVPVAVAVMAFEDANLAHIVPNAVTFIVLVFNAYLLYLAVKIFDGTGVVWLRFTVGCFMKLLTIGYACSAIYLIVYVRDNGVLLRNRWLFGTYVEVPEGVIWVFFGLCWVLAALTFLVGDAQIRLSLDDVFERRRIELGNPDAQAKN